MKTPNGRSHSYSAARPLSTRRSPPPSSISPSSVILPLPGSPTISRIPVDRLSTMAPFDRPAFTHTKGLGR
ncbi:MAG: hypothetical protein QOK16_2206 [Solirubrobacteraceae bacterium]|nr:hypothetical protein [Solirubrobacteraceae bacterium]